MKKIPKTIPTFFPKDFPGGASSVRQDMWGFSIYRGVLVQWDEDHDERVLIMLDEMPTKILEQLLVVNEHEGSISYLWKGKMPPKGYREGDDGVTVCEDYWVICDSKAVSQ